ncbi:MAG TPA: TetR/AcrR family transcriptional regulator [Polyangia bacterium]|jgi:AcrR family transcriptional regulator
MTRPPRDAVTRSAPRRKRPGRYHHGDLRRALLDAALRAIEEEGVNAVTIRALARRLGVSHAAPAHHFHDRDALLVEVATEGFAAFADALEAAARTESDPSRRLVAVGCAYVRFAIDRPAYLRVIFGHGRRNEITAPEPLKREGERAYRALTDTVGALAATVPGAPAPVDELALAAWSLVHGLAMLWIDGPARAVPGGRAGFEALVERTLRRAIPGLVPGARLRQAR